MASLFQGIFGLLMAVLGLPLWLGRVPPNELYGLRTQKTLEDEAIWYRANRYAGGALMIAGGAIVLAWALMPQSMFAGPVGFGLVLAAVVIALAVSMVHARRLA